jgi:hypothetical protein
MTTNADLLTRRNAAVVRGIGHTTPLSASRARNAELWDVEGKRYVDFAGGCKARKGIEAWPDPTLWRPLPIAPVAFDLMPLNRDPDGKISLSRATWELLASQGLN